MNPVGPTWRFKTRSTEGSPAELSEKVEELVDTRRVVGRSRAMEDIVTGHPYIYSAFICVRCRAREISLGKGKVGPYSLRAFYKTFSLKGWENEYRIHECTVLGSGQFLFGPRQGTISAVCSYLSACLV